VIQPGVTRTDMAKAALESLKRSNARVVGVVMNRIPKNRGHYYGGYKYYSSYAGKKGYYSEEENALPVEKPFKEPVPITAQNYIRKPVQAPLQSKPVQTPAHSIQKPVEPYPQAPAEYYKTFSRDLNTEHPPLIKLFDNINVLPDHSPVEDKK
jgi:hypothetical protein